MTPRQPAATSSCWSRPPPTVAAWRRSRSWSAGVAQHEVALGVALRCYLRPVTSDPHVLAHGQAPTPFTADEIRARCAVGKTIRVLVEADGEAPVQRLTRYVECDDSGATIERSALAPDGSVLGDPDVDRVTWLDLQSHASFPVDDTTIEPERIQTPLGELDC